MSDIEFSPLGPFPLLLFGYNKDAEERHELFCRHGGLGGASVYQVYGAMVQIGTATTTTTRVRRTLYGRGGSRGSMK